jgi:hypothetical protein
MAQTGFTPIQLYFSSTTTNTPLAANLANGELAINITDGKLFYKDNANAVQVIGWKVTPTTAGGTGLTSYTAGDLPYYATGTALSKLGIGANTTVMTSTGSAPQWTAQSALSVGTASNLLSNATTGVMQITGPSAASTRVMTIPDANFTVARLDGAQTFTAAQTIQTTGDVFVVGSSSRKLFYRPDTSGVAITTQTGQAGVGIYFNDAGDSAWLLTGSTARLTATSAGNVSVDTGNLVIGTSGKGIDFSATPGTGTSELLADYEEGTWTPVVTAGVGSYTTVSAVDGKYTKVGNLVTIRYYFVVSNKGTGSVYANVAGLPFTSSTVAVGIGCNPTNSKGQTSQLGSGATTFLVINCDATDPVVAGQANQGIMSYFV